MSIRMLSQSANLAELEDWGMTQQSVSKPPSKLRGVEIPLAGSGKCSTGVWECEPGCFERGVEQAEVMHILAGVATFTPTDGKPLFMRAGDSLFFPSHTSGIWEIQETIRKLYVIIDLT